MNYAGVAPDINGLQSLAKEFDLLLIEDNAHGLGGTYRGKPLGSFGDFATQSFHATKNIQCGEGGALVVNNPKFVERAEIIREKGTNRAEYVRGEVNKYQWIDQGSSYLLAELLSAVLLGQLESFSDIQSRRRNIFSEYHAKLSQFKEFEGNESAMEAAHIAYLHITPSSDMEKVKFQLNSRGISASTHYQPLDNSEYCKRKHIKSMPCSNSEQVSKSLLRLPIWYKMSQSEVSHVIEMTRQVLTNDIKAG